jgi:hypothetical protein
MTTLAVQLGGRFQLEALRVAGRAVRVVVACVGEHEGPAGLVDPNVEVDLLSPTVGRHRGIGCLVTTGTVSRNGHRVVTRLAVRHGGDGRRTVTLVADVTARTLHYGVLIVSEVESPTHAGGRLAALGLMTPRAVGRVECEIVCLMAFEAVCVRIESPVEWSQIERIIVASRGRAGVGGLRGV